MGFIGAAARWTACRSCKTNPSPCGAKLARARLRSETNPPIGHDADKTAKKQTPEVVRTHSPIRRRTRRSICTTGLNLSLGLGPESGQAEAQGMQRQAEAQLALRRVAPQQPSRDQRRQQVHRGAVRHPGHALELPRSNPAAPLLRGGQRHGPYRWTALQGRARRRCGRWPNAVGRLAMRLGRNPCEAPAPVRADGCAAPRYGSCGTSSWLTEVRAAQGRSGSLPAPRRHGPGREP
jgi:hypothetical protein